MIKPTYPELINPEIRKLVYKRAFDLYGEDHQLTVATEECAELIQAITKIKRGKPNMDNLIEELADVRIIVEQVEMMFGIALDVQQKIVEKCARNSKRMDEDESDGLCTRCAYRDDCDWPKIHKIKLKECEDFEDGRNCS